MLGMLPHTAQRQRTAIITEHLGHFHILLFPINAATKFGIFFFNYDKKTNQTNKKTQHYFVLDTQDSSRTA